MNDLELKLPEPNYEIVFSADCEWKVKIHTETGRVEFAEGVDLDDASELFWTVLAGESPKALLDEIDELKKRLSDAETEPSRVEEFDLAMISVVKDPEDDCQVQPDNYERAMKVIE